MIQLNSIVQCIDNSRAKKVRCIHIFDKNHSFRPSVCVFRGVVCAVNSKSQAIGKKVRVSDLVLCVIVRSKKHTKIQFNENACILLNDNFEPKANRIIGPITLSTKCPENFRAKITSLITLKQNIFFV